MELELLCDRIIESTKLLKELGKKKRLFQYNLPAGFTTPCGSLVNISRSPPASSYQPSSERLLKRSTPHTSETLLKIIGNAVETIMRIYRLTAGVAKTKDQEYLTYLTNRLKKEVQRTLYLEPESNERVELISNSAQWSRQV